MREVRRAISTRNTAAICGLLFGRFGRKILLLGVPVALVAAACGGGEDKADAADEVASPIAEFLGEESFFGGDPEQMAARFADQERTRQETIAACMTEKGFEYVAYVPEQAFDFTTTGDGLEYDSREYAERYGFGITTQRYSQEEVGPDLVGHDFSQFEENVDEDPNSAIREAMDEATLSAYDEALYGDPDDFPTFDPETMTDEELEAAEAEATSFTPSGCEGEAFAQDTMNAFYNEFGEEMEELYESVLDDPRVKERLAEVSECMSGEGHDIPADGEIWEVMNERFEPVMQEIEASIGGNPAEDMAEEDLASMSEEELTEMFNQPREFPAEAKTKLGEVQAEETAIAVAHWDCGGNAGSQEIILEVVAEYEQRFLDDNAEDVAEFKADA